MRDDVAQARSPSEKEFARHQLALQEQAVAAKQAEFDACRGIPPPPPPASAALLGMTDIFIDTRRDGSWTGGLLRETLRGYTLTFTGQNRSAVVITTVPPPVSVGGGFIRGGPFNLVTGRYVNTATRRGGGFGEFDTNSGRLQVPLFIDFDEGGVFPGVWGIFSHREQAHVDFMMSTETLLPDPLFNFPSGMRVAADGKVVLAAIGTVHGGRSDGRQLAVTIDGQLFPWPLPG